MLEIIAGGLYTTVQDMGRQGGQCLGIPPSGAQDGFALRIANLLVGNPPGGPLVIRDDPGAAGLEITMAGLKVRAKTDLLVAATGADMAATVDGAPAPRWQAFMLRRGELLAFGMATNGARAYLAIHGGIDVPLYLGSRATHVRGQFGGFKGRVLEEGDILPIGQASAGYETLADQQLRPDLVPSYGTDHRLRVVRGPEAHLFEAKSEATFYATAWQLNPKSDRTGMRFIGPELGFRPGRPRYLNEEAGADPSNIVIDPGAPVGTIQVPSGVEPIVLGVDAPSVGGYARIGIVISTDMSIIGQMQPLQYASFVQISHDDAVAALKQQEALISPSSVVS